MAEVSGEDAGISWNTASRAPPRVQETLGNDPARRDR